MAIATTPPENSITPETGLTDTGDQNRSQPVEDKPTKPKRTISNLSASPIGEGLSVESFKFDNLKDSMDLFVF